MRSEEAPRIRAASPSEIDQVLAIYEELGYRREISPLDTFWIAEIGGEPVGIVRIARENGVLVLRGMRVAEAWRARGIGNQMLRAVDAWLGDRECYCVPYAHLVAFYGRIGFVQIEPASGPAFLSERVAEYRRGALEVILMFRGSSSKTTQMASSIQGRVNGLSQQ